VYYLAPQEYAIHRLIHRQGIHTPTASKCRPTRDVRGVAHTSGTGTRPDSTPRRSSAVGDLRRIPDFSKTHLYHPQTAGSIWGFPRNPYHVAPTRRPNRPTSPTGRGRETHRRLSAQKSGRLPQPHRPQEPETTQALTTTRDKEARNRSATTSYPSRFHYPRTAVHGPTCRYDLHTPATSPTLRKKPTKARGVQYTRPHITHTRPYMGM
jgi:hypothetical protein